MKFRKSMFSFIAVFCVMIMFFNIQPVSAKAIVDSISQKIEVLVNSISLYVNNKQVAVDNFIYNGTTYVPLRAVAELTGMKVDWNNDEKRIDLTSDTIFKMKTTDGKYNIITSYPNSLSNSIYPKWKYLTLVFDANTKGIKDNSKVVLMDHKGNKVDVKCKPGDTAHDAFLIVPKNNLELDTYYSLYIPKDNIIMENNDVYGEEILIYFKTANNAIRGEISSDDDLFGKSVIIKNNTNADEAFSTIVVGENEFFFSDIPSGTYEIFIDDSSFGNITIKDNFVNEIKVIRK